MTPDGQDLKQIGERLRKARETAGITQADAAAETGMARTTLVAIEQGQRRVRMDEIQLLARLYKISANALLRDGSRSCRSHAQVPQGNPCRE